MQRLKLVTSSAVLFLLPLTMVSAQGGGLAADGTGGDFGFLLKTILDFSNNTLIPFIIGIGFLVFVWGMFLFFIAGGANEESKEKGKSLMVYALLGFILIIVLWGIVNLLAQTTGLESQGSGNPGLNNITIP